MKKIKLTQNQFTLIDDEDYEKINQYKWHAAYRKSYYAIYSKFIGNNKHKNIKMHRLIMNCPDNMQIDHINHNTLDNRKCNLRIVTNQQNCHNAKAHKNSTSKYKGVHWNKENKNWRSRIIINNKITEIGSFRNEIDAAKMYNKYAKKYFKNFAYLNKI